MYSTTWIISYRTTTGLWLVLILIGLAVAGCTIPVPPADDDTSQTATAPVQNGTAAETQLEDISSDSTQADPPPEAEDAPAETPMARSEFVLDSSRTEARFIVEETLGGAHVVVTGVSTAVTGSLKTSPGQVASTEVSSIVIDASSFVTDNNMRNGAIRRFVLYTNLYPEIVFTPTLLRNAPESIAIGETFDLEIEGSLSLLDTTKTIAFAVTARFESESELAGYGSTTILLEDFGVTVPMPPRVTWVADEVILELEFTAVSSGPPAGVESAQNTLVQLMDPLDEPEFYCLDIPGFGSSVQLQAPLMAHTCKPNSPADEIFDFDSVLGQFHVPAYTLCMEAAGDLAGSEVNLATCSAGSFQSFGMDPEGFIRLADTDLCLTVASGKGSPAGGRSHLRRDLTLEDCTAVAPELARWQLPGSTAG